MNCATRIKYALNPPEEAVFMPAAQIQPDPTGDTRHADHHGNADNNPHTTGTYRYTHPFTNPDDVTHAPAGNCSVKWGQI